MLFYFGLVIYFHFLNAKVNVNHAIYTRVQKDEFKSKDCFVLFNGGFMMSSTLNFQKIMHQLHLMLEFSFSKDSSYNICSSWEAIFEKGKKNNFIICLMFYMSFIRILSEGFCLFDF